MLAELSVSSTAIAELMSYDDRRHHVCVICAMMVGEFGMDLGRAGSEVGLLGLQIRVLCAHNPSD